MNRPFNPSTGAPVNPLSGRPCQLAGADAPRTGNYSFRTTDCSSCDGNPWFGIGHGSRCEECDGTGETDLACADCGNVNALNDDGLCKACSEHPLLEFQERLLGDGFYRVEM